MELRLELLDIKLERTFEKLENLKTEKNESVLKLDFEKYKNLKERINNLETRVKKYEDKKDMCQRYEKLEAKFSLVSRDIDNFEESLEK